MSGKILVKVKEHGRIVGKTVAYADPLHAKHKSAGAESPSTASFQLGHSAVRAISKSLAKTP
jgi:hypothetical protein